MQLRNTSSQFGTVARTLHWLTALGVLVMAIIGFWATSNAETLLTSETFPSDDFVARTVFLFSLHKTLGILVLFTALVRIAWAMSQPRPAPLHPENRLETFIAGTVHWSLYGALVLVPLTGWVNHAATSGFAPIWGPIGQNLPLIPKSNALAELFSTLHWLTGRLLLAAIALHVIGALKHHLIDRDATLMRMLRGRADLRQMTAPARFETAPAIAALTIWISLLAAGTMISLQQTSKDSLASKPNGATQWQILHANLEFRLQHRGQPLSGQFTTLDATLLFDDPPAPGPAGAINATVTVSSLNFGPYTDVTLGPDILDADFYPDASFKALLEKTETGYLANGHLTIRDIPLHIQIPFDVAAQNDILEFTGSVELDRFDFGIGVSLGEDQLNPIISLRFEVTATQAP